MRKRFLNRLTVISSALFQEKSVISSLLEMDRKAKFAVYLYQGPLKIDHENRIIFLPAWMVWFLILGVMHVHLVIHS